MGILRFRNANNSGYIDPATATGFKFRNAANTGYIDKTSLNGLAIRNQTNTGWITFSAGVSYSITPSTTSVNEGQTVTFTINTSGLGSGTLYWTNSGTTVGADFTDGQNSGSVVIAGDTGSFSRTLSADGLTEGSQTVVISLRTGSTSGPIVATATSVTVVDSSTTPSFPSSLTFTRNDLEFAYSSVINSTNPDAYAELICTFDLSNFWTKATSSFDHFIIAFDTKGDSSVFAPDGTRDHCGQIARNGQPLWDEARGFILYRDGRFSAEHWYAGKPAGTPGFGIFDFGSTWNPVATSVFTVRMRAGYRSGTYGEKMEIDYFAGTTTGGALLGGGLVPWGWDWTGNHKLAIAGIMSGFISPNDSGCIETSAAGPGAGAVIGVSNFNFNTYV